MFKQITSNIEFPKLETKSVNGLRYYLVNSELYPSITSILSIKSNEKIQAWKDRLGEDVAQFESSRAAQRGTNFHTICEEYLKNQDISKHGNNVLSFGLFNLIKKEIERIDNVRGLEVNLYSSQHEIAGRADCIAEFDGLLSIIDFKSANRARTDDLLEKHSIQETAYAKMWEELTNIPIEQIVTIVACENGDSQIVINKPAFFLKRLEECIKEFRIHEKSTVIRNGN